MSTISKIFKSNEVTSEERHIERIKKEIEFLTEDLQIRESHLVQLKTKQK